MKKPLLLGVALLTSLLSSSAFGQAHEHSGPASHTLEFIENKGQWDARARYEAALPGGRLFAEARGLTFSLLKDGGPAQLGHTIKFGDKAHPAEDLLRGHALTLHFEGASPATITPETLVDEHRNYFLGSDAKRWASNVRSFRELHYAGLWPGVSARVYESADQHLEYDFELAPGARPVAIGLRHQGADGLRLDAAGNLLVKTSVGTITERAPQAWQTDAAGQRQPVACRYVLAGQVVHFALGQYDATRPLTIDPVVVFSTYTGSVADNWGFTATYDNAGNLYSGGIVFAQGYPVTQGAFQTLFADVIDIAIIKYNPNANGPASRVWASYLGGSSADFPASLVVNSQGELLVLGTTSSRRTQLDIGYPVTAGALQPAFAGGTYSDPYYGSSSGSGYALPNGSDLVITRFNATGTALVGSTYLGGTGNEGVLPLNINTTAQLAHNYGDPFRGDILVDAADNVYIASNTTSTNFPLARGFNGAYRGGATDGLVLKLNPTLTALTWGSYLGGSASDAAYSVQVEATSGDVYVAGGTLSANFPTTAGSYRPTRPGDVDGFVARIAASGTSLTRATYLGTSSYDQSYFLQLGTDGGVYVLGQTAGTYPTTPGLYNTPNGRQFIHKLDPTLSTTQLATVFGSGQNTIDLDPTAFLVDRCDRVYVCGWGGELNQGFGTEPYLALNGTTAGLPTTSGAVQSSTDNNDFYLAQFSAGLTSLAYATYYGATTFFGGDHVDGGTARFDPRGVVYQSVCSCGITTGFPIPPGANTFSTFNGSGNCNNASFVFNFEPSIANAGAAQTVCATAGPQALVGSPGGGTWSGPGVTGSLAQGFTFTPTVALAGVQTLTYTVLSTGLCTTTDTRRVTVTVPPTVSFVPLPAFCLPLPGTPPLPLVALTGTPRGGTFSGTGVSGDTTRGFFFSPNQAPGTYQLVYTLSRGGCVVRATQPAVVTTQLTATVAADTLLCPGSTQRFRLRGSPAGGVFSGPGVSGDVSTGFFFTPTAGFTGPVSVTYTATNGNCSGTATRRIAVAPTPLLQAFWDPVNCPEARLAPLTVRFTLSSSINFSQFPRVWDFGDGTQSTEASPTHTYATPGTYRPVVRVRYNSDRCETQASAPPVEVVAQNIPNIITPNGDEKNQTFKIGPDCAPRLQVFSRWGQQVFESAAYHDEWSASGVPDGVYYYLLSYPDGHRVKGWVEVIR